MNAQLAGALPIFIDLIPKGSGGDNLADFGFINTELRTDGLQGCRLCDILTLGKIRVEQGPVVIVPMTFFFGPLTHLLCQAAVVNFFALSKWQTELIRNLLHVPHSLDHIKVPTGVVVSERKAFGRYGRI